MKVKLQEGNRSTILEYQYKKTPSKLEELPPFSMCTLQTSVCDEAGNILQT